MSIDPSDLERRVAALERRLDLEAGVRASQDADLSGAELKLDAQTRLLQALARNDSHHLAVLSEHTGLLARHDAVLTDQSTALANLQSGVTHIISLLDRLTTDDERTES